MMVDFGAPARTASRRAISSGVPSLIFNKGRCAFFAACACISAGSAKDSV
eukprot:CAMPEP_0184413964 /NCGR_PEP_ID=MMETSP0738-20130409/7637_1 /TAXON_ID=385413 /ORGANISM="Thalassiosira miniscula, Strain CCMP1093" /LENGTH=49 /DNA_ID=CAMNT_0026772855 /DNA_START=190 /DNA_END=339 /DNA_ORIENTATION=-